MRRQSSLAIRAAIVLGITTVLMGLSASVSAATLIDSHNNIIDTSIVNPRAAAAAPACLPTHAIPSGDAIDANGNHVVELLLGPGNAVTGIAFDTKLTTVGGSLLSEARLRLSTSARNGARVLDLVPAGIDNARPGSVSINSGGVLSFADLGLPNLLTGSDGILRLQFFEAHDNYAESSDAHWNPAGRFDSPDHGLCSGIYLQCSQQNACNTAVGGSPATAVPTLNIIGVATTLNLVLVLGAVTLFRRRLSSTVTGKATH